MPQVIFACFKGISFQSKLIRFWTRGQFSHIAFVIDTTNYNNLIEPINNKYWGYSNIFRHSPKTKIYYYKKNVTEKQYKIVNNFFIQLANDKVKYDWKGILGFVFKNKDNKNKYFCSEAATISLINGGIWPKSLRPYRVSPTYFVDLLEVSGFKLDVEFTIP